jgi:hypothetical protein
MDTIEQLRRRIGELEDEAKAKDARIAELRAEVDKGKALVEELRQQVVDGNEMIDSWIEAFGMTLDDDGDYVWVAGLSEDYDALMQERNELVADWNRFVPRSMP